MALVDLLREAKKGSKQVAKARKGRVKIYATIEKALKSGASHGTIFSTKGADRLYVITKPTWGEKSKGGPGGGSKIAKGFTPGSSTPGSSWPSIKGYAVRTMRKHGQQRSKKFKKYEVHD